MEKSSSYSPKNPVESVASSMLDFSSAIQERHAASFASAVDRLRNAQSGFLGAALYVAFLDSIGRAGAVAGEFGAGTLGGFATLASIVLNPTQAVDVFKSIDEGAKQRRRIRRNG